MKSLNRALAASLLFLSSLGFLIIDGVREGIDRVGHHGPSVLRHAGQWWLLHAVIFGLPFGLTTAVLLLALRRAARFNVDRRLVGAWSLAMLWTAWVASFAPDALHRVSMLPNGCFTVACVYVLAGTGCVSVAYVFWPSGESVLTNGRTVAVGAMLFGVAGLVAMSLL